MFMRGYLQRCDLCVARRLHSLTLQDEGESLVADSADTPPTGEHDIRWTNWSNDRPTGFKQFPYLKNRSFATVYPGARVSD